MSALALFGDVRRPYDRPYVVRHGDQEKERHGLDEARMCTARWISDCLWPNPSFRTGDGAKAFAAAQLAAYAIPVEGGSVALPDGRSIAVVPAGGAR